MVEGKNNHLDPRSKQVKKEQVNLTFNLNCYLSSVSISQFFLPINGINISLLKA